MTTIDATGWTREQYEDAAAVDQLDALRGPDYHLPPVESAPDYPLQAVVDMLESTIVTSRTVEDQLREHGKAITPNASTGAFDTLIKGAYLKAEDDVVSALALLQNAAQLVRGLAR